ncbi:amidase signature enzyme [Sparassis latifolia]|uniref:Amidase signature enzyme n=1 Tax=Sparassis crispa TaxID=139825 RepID=A0A401H3T8_9APHY|nr:amidase signature enzyme [Sparassis crispa]GBE89010.1 amidase signature enzyme [Sparassis crispa]
MFSYFAHRKSCAQKQQERKSKLESVPAVYSAPATNDDRRILSLSLAELVEECSMNRTSPNAVLQAYGKRCLQAQAATNCLSDIMFDEAERTVTSGKLLSGVPVSLKDCVDIVGHDTLLGYSCNVAKPRQSSASIVHILQDAGALLYVKTSAPTGLLSFETESDVLGVTTNPYNPKFSPGGSTGGGGALLAYQGSMIEVGTDLAGSVRFPAANCGVYSLKGSIGRFPAYGCTPCLPGLQGVVTVTAPMAQNLADLEEFWKRVMEMKPWDYDSTCLPMPWRPVNAQFSEVKPRWGVIWDDGIVTPTPACRRALVDTVDALRRQGFDVVEFESPGIPEGTRIGFGLIACGASPIFNSLRTSETLNSALRSFGILVSLPRWVKWLYALLLRLFSRPLGRNDTWATLAENCYKRSPVGEHELLVQLEDYKMAWHTALQKQDVDFVLTVPHPSPPVPLGGTGVVSLIASSYAFIFSLLDAVAGVVPVTFVDKSLDALPADFRRSSAYMNMSDIGRAVHSVYDARAMHGLPLGVQIVGPRLHEEKVLAGMKIIDNALRAAGRGFVPKQF